MLPEGNNNAFFSLLASMRVIAEGVLMAVLCSTVLSLVIMWYLELMSLAVRPISISHDNWTHRVAEVPIFTILLSSFDC